RLAERYDLALMSTKGLSVTASRQLVDQLCAAYGIPLLVLHDFDKSGFSIVGTLRRGTRGYQFANAVEVIGLGLRLAAGPACGLEAEDVYYRSHPRCNLLENGASAEEVAFLCAGRDYARGYRGRRVELNAFASAELVGWVESKLHACGVRKVVPDGAALEAA